MAGGPLAGLSFVDVVRMACVVGFVLLAGCSGDVPDPPPRPELVAPDSFEEFDLQETAPQSGVIRGVVVDASITPLAGAFVELVGQGQNVTTGDSGAFAFKDVVPGMHFVKASLRSHESTQTSVDVVAGVAEPEVVRVMLPRVPGTEPYAVGAVFEGFINCSIRIPAAGFNDGCGVFGDIVLGSTQRIDLLYEGSGIQWWQGELVWDATNVASERLCLGLYAETMAGDDVCGPNPVVQAMNRTLVEINDLESGEAFDLFVYPDHLAADVSGNLVVQQGFKVVHYAFYNFAPADGWTFVADGEPKP